MPFVTAETAEVFVKIRGGVAGINSCTQLFLRELLD
jgi:hypothetical protein